MVENELLKKLLNPPVLLEKEHFLVKFAENQQEIDAAKRLRYNVFMAEQGHTACPSAADAIDEDEFDQYCGAGRVCDANCWSFGECK